MNGIAGKEIHDVEAGGHNFSNGCNIVLGVIIDWKFPQFVPVSQVAVITSEDDLLVIGDGDRGTGENVLCNGLVYEIIQR